MAGDPDIAARLRLARETAGYETAQEAYDDFDDWGIGIEAYNHRENGRTPLSLAEATLYANRYGVNLVWLAEGKGPMRGGEANPLTGLKPAAQTHILGIIESLRDS